MSYRDEPWDGEHCMKCNRGYDDVYRVSDAEWERASGRTDGSGLLCPRCCGVSGMEPPVEREMDPVVRETDEGYAVDFKGNTVTFARDEGLKAVNYALSRASRVRVDCTITVS